MKYVTYLIRFFLYKLDFKPKRSDLIGKHVLVGIIFLGEYDRTVEYFQTHGLIKNIDDHLGVIIEKADGSGTYTIPPWPLRFIPARPGNYRLRVNGTVVANPDYLSNWTIENMQPNTIAAYKVLGFGPFQSR